MGNRFSDLALHGDAGQGEFINRVGAVDPAPDLSGVGEDTFAVFVLTQDADSDTHVHRSNDDILADEVLSEQIVFAFSHLRLSFQFPVQE